MAERTRSWKEEDPPAPLRPQRGGTPTLEEFRYRDREVDALWEQLAAGESIVLTAEKRVGKSAVLRLLNARSSGGLSMVMRDVEHVGTPKRLVELLCADLMPLLPADQRAKKRLGRVWSKFGGLEIGSFALPNFDEKHWQNELNELFDALAEHLDEEGKSLAILWDEAPWMIEKVERDCGWQTAADLLDELRAIRQRHRCIRFLFTGSIGFHHVLRQLRDGESHRPSINDLRPVELPPLRPVDAGRLAWALLLWTIGDGQAHDEPVPDIAERMAARCAGIPWFIHAAANDLRHLDAPLTVAAVDIVIEAARRSSTDGWQLRHYVDRLGGYYGDQAPLAELVLDAVAVRGTASPSEILEDLAHDGPVPSKAVLRDLLRLLQEDHYLTRESNQWRFTYQLIREAWLDLQDLEPLSKVPG